MLELKTYCPLWITVEKLNKQPVTTCECRGCHVTKIQRIVWGVYCNTTKICFKSRFYGKTNTVMLRVSRKNFLLSRVNRILSLTAFTNRQTDMAIRQYRQAVSVLKLKDILNTYLVSSFWNIVCRTQLWMLKPNQSIYLRRIRDSSLCRLRSWFC